MARQKQPIEKISRAAVYKRAHRAVSLVGASCSDCGSLNLLDRHHSDYSKPEDVVILCRQCHRKRDEADGTWKLRRVETAQCLICRTDFQPKRTRRAKLCGNPECLRQSGIISAQKRWKTGEIDCAR